MLQRHNIAGGIWFIESGFAQSHLPLVTNYLKGHVKLTPAIIDDTKLTERNSISVITPVAGVYQVDDYGSRVKPENAPSNAIAVIDIMDVITKHDQDCGPAGMVTKSKIIKRCYQNSNIEAIVLKIDSGGGEGYAMFNMEQTLSERTKPVYAYVSDLAASAAYGIASCCDAIYANMDVAQIGSVGAYTTLVDYKPFLEKQGVKVHEIYASQSKDKNIEVREAFKGNYVPLRTKISAFNQKFIDMVANNRGAKLTGKPENWNTGAIMPATEALKIGLIDKVCTWDEAIADIESKLSSSNSSPMKKQPVQLNAVLNVDQLESTKDGVFLNENQIEAVETELSSLSSKLQKAETEKTTALSEKQKSDDAKAEAEQKLATANSSIESKEQEIENLKTQVLNLQNNASGHVRRVVSKADGTDEIEDSFVDTVNSARSIFGKLPD